MEYADFYNIAEYGNVAWKGGFSQKEIACNAHCYYADFEWSKENENISETIKTLAKNLADDLRNISEDDANYEEVKHWLYQMADELGLLDMDYQDYLDTDEWFGNLV